MLKSPLLGLPKNRSQGRCCKAKTEPEQRGAKAPEKGQRKDCQQLVGSFCIQREH